MNRPKSHLVLWSFLFATIFASPVILLAQMRSNPSAAEIQLALQKMQTLGSVLYIGAHPDDENNDLLSYLAQGAHYRTAYLSATRGDGGQNHIGDELGASLGILRTLELLAARRIDGGEQFFSRALDFGYTTSPEATLKKWGHEAILADFVWVIRRFQPDIMIARFPTTGEGRHGHHTASAILAGEAFRAAADPQRFPEQLEYVQPWQAKRLLWNAWPEVISARGGDPAKLIKMDIGSFNPLLGQSYTEIGAAARSMHKCQGMGTLSSRGPEIEYFEVLNGESASNALFENIDTSWKRIDGGIAVGWQLAEALHSFEPAAPQKTLPALAKAYHELQSLPKSQWVIYKMRELKTLIKACAGLWMQAIADDYSAAPGDSVHIAATLINRSDAQIELTALKINEFSWQQTTDLPNNQPFAQHIVIALPADAAISQPYWLRQPALPGRYVVDDQQMIGRPDNPPALVVWAMLRVDDAELEFDLPVEYRWRDQFDGDWYRPFEIVPKVTANIEQSAYIFADQQAKLVRARVKSGRNNIAGTLRLELPANWQVEPASHAFSLQHKEDEALLSFSVRPPAQASDATIRAMLQVDGQTLSQELVRIDYKHVPIKSYFPPASARAVRLDLKKGDEKIGYVMGAGDLVPQSLEQIGYSVTLLGDDDLEKNDLSAFQTIITGVRAYSTRQRLKQLHQRLLDFVAAGGTLVVQYNGNRGNVIDNIGPYPMRLSFERVDEEDAPITFVAPDHPLLNRPNRITQQDFEDWVHDRGIYFADQYDPHYQTVLSSHDTGKAPLEGGLLYAKYGKGIFIYTGLSFFRQLPAGVPGGYRLLVNLISAKQGE